MMCFFYADTEDELLDTLDEILARLESVGLFAAAHKCTFFSREIVRRGKVYSCLLYTSPSPRDRQKSRMPSSA